ncbi:dnaJ-like protein 60 [Anopheles aquasalis]|uniref:dnaJ-like protein 60 n=1 Tax=Anopheles aquasalis TaxID=42839 RepID=UPI00215AF53D|nr:dnaJ-like protein 60 [Anopheles aquasalis]
MEEIAVINNEPTSGYTVLGVGSENSFIVELPATAEELAVIDDALQVEDGGKTIIDEDYSMDDEPATAEELAVIYDENPTHKYFCTQCKKNFKSKDTLRWKHAMAHLLCKPDSRAAYDYELSLGRDFKTNDQPIFHRPWSSGHKHYSTEEQPYYGIKGVKKVSNWTIVAFCAIFMLFGIVVQTVAISKSFTFKRNQLDEFSRQNAIQHAEVREEAVKYGNKAQIERMKAKLNKEVV